jgi:glycosyltransferase involved in cell wall biosynthesis
MSGEQPTICFVAPSAYPILAGDRSIREVGGAQIQQCILAREFVSRNYKVSMICMNYGQDDGIDIDGIKVYRAHAPSEGVPVLRFIHPRLTSIWRAMRRANADIYYQRTASALTGIVVAFAKAHRKISIYAAASDRDFFAETPHIRYGRDRAIYRWALRRADLVIAQTESQRETCERNFGRAPTVIRSCYGHQGKLADQKGVIIWAGRILPVKRAELFIELARRLPQYTFKLIGGDDADIVPLRRLANGLGNLVLTGFVPFVDIESHFDGPALLVNTSSNEGFPNTFLQAWSRGMPTVSFFDPRAVSEGRRVGSVVATFDEMIVQIKALKDVPALWEQQSKLCRNYFVETFSAREAVSAYQSALGDLPWHLSTSSQGAEG